MLSAVHITPNASHVEYLDPVPTLLDLLSNHLILVQTAPYLSASTRLNLASASHDFRGLVLHTPGVFRHLDLTHTRAAQLDIAPVDRGGETWRNAQLDENVTEDEFYSGPLRGIFSRLSHHNLLADVQTLILDTLPVTSELCHELILDPSYNIRLLSLRGSKHLNERQLCRTLQYACRPTRPENTPRLKALYIFGAPDMAHAPDDWHNRKGRMICRAPLDEWAATLVDCRGLIAFDALPCNGPRHISSPAYGKVPASHLVTAPGSRDSHPQWAVATHAVPGCAGCGAAPEGVTTHAGTPSSLLPLLAPPPLLSSSVRAATVPCSASPSSGFVARCADCLRDRYCNSCNKWWCEECYVPPTAPASPGPVNLAAADVVIVNPDGDAWVQQHEDEEHRTSHAKSKGRIIKSCWECGSNCHDCIEQTQRFCRGCCGGYCTTHNEGSTAHFCDCMPHLDPSQRFVC
ncbi:hypothetical protein HYQ45_018497 [Verticillium longisporum]|uniref:Ubiquitin fusion degradation protein n=1 Tax=Verticillium longisporum TaxID=100787 RepID=A0A8I2Z075_VERLO|nr:hypothetical protein HYQ45_018497 [Verticillium longisporum]